MRRLALLFVLLTALAWAQRPVCFFCKHDGSQHPLAPVEYTAGTRQVCQRCDKRLPACESCDLPSGNPQYRDGRNICHSCMQTGISTQVEAEKLYKEVVRFADGMLGAKVSPLPPVRLCDFDELQTKQIEGWGRAVVVIGFYQAYNPEQIYLLSYEPRVRCGATLAHEYTHAWQSRHSPQQDRALKEGFATWVEYHYLLSQGRHDLASSLRNHQNPDYGKSLNQLLELEKKQGRAAVIKLGRTGTKL